MAKFNESDGFHIYGWMTTRLHLSGGELLAYAVVRQFSQSNAGIYTGGVPYLSMIIGCSGESARKYLHSLTDKGLIEQIDATRNNVPYKHYRATPKDFGCTPKEIGGVSQENWGDTPKNFGGEYNMNRNKKEEDKDNNNSTASRFQIPSLEDVRDYCRMRGNSVDPQQFIDYYSANGWRVGKNPMKDWRAAIRTWEANRKTSSTRPAYQQRKPESVWEHNARIVENIARSFQNDQPYDEQ